MDEITENEVINQLMESVYSKQEENRIIAEEAENTKFLLISVAISCSLMSFSLGFVIAIFLK